MFLKKSNHLNQPFTFGFPCSNFRGGFFLVQQLGSQQVLQQEASLRVDFLQMTKIRWLSIFFGLVLVCPSKTYPSKQNHGSAQRGCISNRIIIFQICSHFPLNNDYGRKINIWWCLKRGKFNDASHFSIDPCYNATNTTWPENLRAVHGPWEAQISKQPSCTRYGVLPQFQGASIVGYKEGSHLVSGIPICCK